MAIFERAKSALGEIEERLRRSLGLVGLIETDFEPSAKPFVLVDDATRPGCNARRGRFWQSILATSVATVTTNSITYRAVNPIIIDRVIVSLEKLAVVDANQASMQMRLLEPTLADPYALNPATSGSGSFVENFTAANDRPGLLAGNAAAPVATGTNIGQFLFDQTFILPTQIFLPVAGKVAFNLGHNGAATHVVILTLQGRIF